jgi:hypothetical protein
MTAKLITLAGALTGCAVLLPAAHAMQGDLVLRTFGNTDMLYPTSRCPGGVARVRLGVRVGTRTVMIGPTLLRLPVIVQTGTATFCGRKHGRRVTAGVTRTTASGRLTLALAAGTIQAAANETQSSKAGRTTSYSLLGTIRGGTGLYRRAAGVVVARGTVGPAPDGRQCRKVTFRVELA